MAKWMLILKLYTEFEFPCTGGTNDTHYIHVSLKWVFDIASVMY